jgi:hypothetical protein
VLLCPRAFPPSGSDAHIDDEEEEEESDSSGGGDNDADSSSDGGIGRKRRQTRTATATVATRTSSRPTRATAKASGETHTFRVGHNHKYIGLARTIYIRCTYGIFGLEITKYTVYIYVYIRFWPTLLIYGVNTVVLAGVYQIYRVGQNHTFIGLYGVYTVFSAGKSPYIRSDTVQKYGSGQPYKYTVMYSVYIQS